MPTQYNVEGDLVVEVLVEVTIPVDVTYETDTDDPGSEITEQLEGDLREMVETETGGYVMEGRVNQCDLNVTLAYHPPTPEVDIDGASF